MAVSCSLFSSVSYTKWTNLFTVSAEVVYKTVESFQLARLRPFVVAVATSVPSWQRTKGGPLCLKHMPQKTEAEPFYAGLVPRTKFKSPRGVPIAKVHSAFLNVSNIFYSSFFYCI